MTVLPNPNVRKHEFAIAPYMRFDDLCSPYFQKRAPDNSTHYPTPYSKRHKIQVMPSRWASLPRCVKGFEAQRIFRRRLGNGPCLPTNDKHRFYEVEKWEFLVL